MYVSTFIKSDVTSRDIFRSFISREYIEWNGRITRTSGSIDSQTRLVYAYAEVINPYDESPPLAIGTYVDAEIEGNFISGGFIIPNAAIKNGNEIYLIDNGNKLRIKKIEVVGTENEDVIIFGDIDENDMIVVSTLNTGYEGMELTPMKLENKEAL